MKTMKLFIGLILCMSIGLTFIACGNDGKDEEVIDDSIVGIWYGDIDEEECELTFMSDNTAIMVATDADDYDEIVRKYNYKKNVNKYILTISHRPQYASDDWDQLLVEYVNENRILVYSNFGDGDDRLYGTLTRKK